jgi:hypothetical protein
MSENEINHENLQHSVEVLIAEQIMKSEISEKGEKIDILQNKVEFIDYNTKGIHLEYLKTQNENTEHNKIEEIEKHEDSNINKIFEKININIDHQQILNNLIELKHNNFEKNQDNIIEPLSKIEISSEKEEVGLNLEAYEPSKTIEMSENKEEKLKFYDNLRTVIKTQGNILTMTSMAKEKIHMANEISIDQLKNFKDNSQKYGKYLKMIHEELQLVSDLMKKIKKEVTK